MNGMVSFGGITLTVPVDITDPRIAKAYGHPLRIHILGKLDNRVASPSELASELDAPLTHVSYHVRQLAGLGLIKLVKTTPRRGAVEHHYTAKIRPTITDKAWAEVPEVVKKNHISGWVEQAGQHVSAAVAEGGFERDNAHFSRTALELDAKGWNAVAKELEKALERIDRIASETKKRLDADSNGELQKATAILLFFEGPYQAAGLPADAGIRRHKRRRAKTTA
jgi:DNA-binding transcriptional ArsR family regulator